MDLILGIFTFMFVSSARVEEASLSVCLSKQAQTHAHTLLYRLLLVIVKILMSCFTTQVFSDGFHWTNVLD